MKLCLQPENLFSITFRVADFKYSSLIFTIYIFFFSMYCNILLLLLSLLILLLLSVGAAGVVGVA